MLSGDPLKQVLAGGGIDGSLFDTPTDTPGGGIEHLVVPGADAIEVWQQLRRLLPQSGRAPIVVAEVSQTDIREALTTAAAELDDTLARAETFDPELWLAARYAHDEGESDDDAFEDDPIDDLVALAEELGLDPEDLPEIEQDSAPRFSLPYEVLSKKALRKVDILLLPSERSWEAPAYLGFGGWNECPLPHEQVAVLALWRRLYGSEVFGLSSDVLELEVTRPPTDEIAARILARQQYDFCPDLVDQGFLSLARLARGLEGAGSWSFWWD